MKLRPYGAITDCTVVQAMGQVNGRGRFSTLHSSETPRPIFMKLQIYNYFPDTTPHAKFQGPTYPVKNCNNSVLGGRIKFILGS